MRREKEKKSNWLFSQQQSLKCSINRGGKLNEMKTKDSQDWQTKRNINFNIITSWGPTSIVDHITSYHNWIFGERRGEKKKNMLHRKMLASQKYA